METLLTRQIKADLLHFYRFERDLRAVQECQGKDVLVCDKKFSNFYEYEVKISKSDLKQELKKPKHKSPNVNYYYIVVPIKLKAEALEIAEKLNPKYGVMLYTGKFFSTVKNAKRLISTVDNYLEKAFMWKLTGDYATWYGEIQLYREDRLKTLPKNCSSKARSVYYRLLKKYPLSVVQKFEYIAKSDEIRYINHRIIFQKTQVKASSAYKYSGGKWIDYIMAEVERWLQSEKRSVTQWLK